MFVFPYSNGITEGFHRQMKLSSAAPTASETLKDIDYG